MENLKRRLVLEQKKSFKNTLSKAFKPSAEVLSEKITGFNENINGIDMDDPAISEVHGSFTLSDCSLQSVRRSLRDEEMTSATFGVETAPTETVPDADQNKVPLLSDSKTSQIRIMRKC